MYRTNESFSIPKKDFTVKESDHIDPIILKHILNNKAVGLLVKNYLGKAYCKKIAENFDKAILECREDDVPAIKIGSDHYGKTLEAYLQEVEHTANKVTKLFYDVLDLPQKIRYDLQKALPKQNLLRRSSYKGRLAGEVRAVTWKGKNDYALAIHEDFSQLTTPEQKGFEIQEVSNPVAINFYPKVENAGNFIAYNLQPSLEIRKSFGIEYTGYPYPKDFLSSLQRMELKVESDDLLIWNGRFLHGVLQSPCKEKEYRLLINFFIGKTKKNGDILYWT